MIKTGLVKSSPSCRLLHLKRKKAIETGGVQWRCNNCNKIRAFATNGEATNNAAPRRTDSLVKLKNFAMSRTGLGLIGGSFVFLGVSRVVYDVMHTFMHLDFFTVAEVGAAVGIVSASCTFALGVGVYRATTIRAEKVFLDSLDRIKRSPLVLERLNKNYQNAIIKPSLIPSKTRAYQMDYGSFGFDVKPVWNKPRVVLMFKVTGDDEKQHGIVVVDTERKITGAFDCKSLSVQILPDTLIVVEGSEEQVEKSRARLLGDLKEIAQSKFIQK